MRIAAMYHYPVKGLSPQSISSVELETDGYFPCDRLLALENGPSGFDPDAPEHQPKIKFLMLMRNGALAGLETRYDAASDMLSVRKDGLELLRESTGEAAGRARIEGFFADFLAAELRGPVRLLAAPDRFRFTDSKAGFVSLVNLASVAAIETAQGAPVDPLRFRANLYLEDLDAWGETALIGKTLTVGGAKLEILKMTDRCAATGVEPGTGVRDMDLVQTLRKTFDHVDCGVYARIASGGRVAVGDRLSEG